MYSKANAKVCFLGNAPFFYFKKRKCIVMDIIDRKIIHLLQGNDHEALGYHITAFIHMALDPKQKPTFYPFVDACPNVLECNCVTGAHSMLMKVCFPNTMDLDSFIGQLQRFGSTETQIVFSTPVPTRGVVIDTDELDSSEAI